MAKRTRSNGNTEPRRRRRSQGFRPMPGERWLAVPGYEGLYEVSDFGRVRSLDRRVINKLGREQLCRGTVLYTNMVGLRRQYHSVVLRNSGDAQRVTVHSLVLQAFVGPAPDGTECRHLDGNPDNNHLANLRWGTRSENILDTVRHGTQWQAAKTKCPRGHELKEPNLYSWPSWPGRRCKACERARCRLRNNPLAGDLQTISDRYYEEIMSSLAGAEMA